LSPSASAPLPALLSFPTRRSSDLFPALEPDQLQQFRRRRLAFVFRAVGHFQRQRDVGKRRAPWQERRILKHEADVAPPPRRTRRSEEHTSELQSPDHLVCRLLLEK